MKECGSEPPTMHSDRVSTTGSEGRKSSKPIMEKRRRARINASLAELKSLLLEVIKKEGARHSKMEKADILEMAVKHLRHIQRAQYTSGGSDPTLTDKYRLGFNECAQEVSRYLGAADDDDAELRARLLNHLANCITSSDDALSPLSTPSSSPGPSLHAAGQVSSSSGSPESGSGGAGGGVVTPIPVRPGSKPPMGSGGGGGVGGGGGSLAGFSMLAVGANSNPAHAPPLQPPSAALLLQSNPAEINNNVATFANNNIVFSSADVLNAGGGGAGFPRGVGHHHVTLTTTATAAAAASSSPPTSSLSQQPQAVSFPGTKWFGELQVMSSPTSTNSNSSSAKTPPAAPAAVTPVPGAALPLPVSVSAPAPAAGEVTFVLPANVMTGGPFHSYLIPVITSPHGLAAPNVSLTHNPVSAATAAAAHAPLPLSLPVMAAAPPQGSVAGSVSAAPAPQGLVTFSPGGGAVSHVVATGPLNASLAWHPAAASNAFTTAATPVYNPSSTFSSPPPSAQTSTAAPSTLSASSPSPSLSPAASTTPSARAAASPLASSSSPSSAITSTTAVPEEPAGPIPLLAALSPEKTSRDGAVSLVLPRSQIRATSAALQIGAQPALHSGSTGDVCGPPASSNAGGSSSGRRESSLLHSQLARPHPLLGFPQSSSLSSTSSPSTSALPGGAEPHDSDESVWRPW